MMNEYKGQDILEFNYLSEEERHDVIDLMPPADYCAQEQVTAESVKESATAVEFKPAKRHMGQKIKNRISNTIIYVVLCLMSTIWLIPFVCILLESFRVESTSQVGYIIPKEWGLDNYINLFTKTKFLRWMGNTFVLGLVVSVLQTAFVLSMSYVLSRFKFRGRKSLMNLMLILGMFPGFLTLILIYNLLNGWGMTGENSVFGLILVYVASSGMGYYVSKGFFDTISKSLDEAARIDGATRFQIFYKIIMPLAKPIVIYTILTAFMAPWGDFVMAKYIAHNSSAGFNVAVGLQILIASEESKATNYTMFCAGGVVVAVPITVLFMLLQKYYVAGVTGGAVKG